MTWESLENNLGKPQKQPEKAWKIKWESLENDLGKAGKQPKKG